jgi:hypothetical protein
MVCDAVYSDRRLWVLRLSILFPFSMYGSKFLRKVGSHLLSLGVGSRGLRVQEEGSLGGHPLCVCGNTRDFILGSRPCKVATYTAHCSEAQNMSHFAVFSVTGLNIWEQWHCQRKSEYLCTKFVYSVTFEAFTAVIMKFVVFWDMSLCRSCVNSSFVFM